MDKNLEIVVLLLLSLFLKLLELNMICSYFVQINYYICIVNFIKLIYYIQASSLMVKGPIESFQQ